MDGDTRRLASRASTAIRHTPRRVVLTGLGAAALALLVDRGLRLDLPQPPPPVPTRRPAPDESILLPAVADLREVVDATSSLVAARPNDALAARLEKLFAEQLRVLTGRLTNAGVPSEVIDAATPRPAAPATATTTGSPATTGTPSPTSSATGRPPTSPRPPRTRAELARRLDRITAADWAAAAGATTRTRELLSAAYGMRLASARLLGREVPLADTATPARPAMAAQTLPLVYAFEVVAAQSADSVRERALGTLDDLHVLAREVSGPDTADPGGWALPHPVTTPAEARRLATEVMRSAVASQVDVAGAKPTATVLEDVARWSAAVQSLATDWSVPLTAFPGTER